MKNITLILLLFISFNSYSQFRNTTWGMDIDEVKKIEKAEILNSIESNSLNYKVQTAEAKCKLVYEFVENKLIKIKYEFSNIDNNSEIILNERSKLWVSTITNLKNKYGEIHSQNKNVIVWQSPKYTIRAFIFEPYDRKQVIVEYTPPIASQKDLL